jgi:hypothetical protein
MFPSHDPQPQEQPAELEQPETITSQPKEQHKPTGPTGEELARIEQQKQHGIDVAKKKHEIREKGRVIEEYMRDYKSPESCKYDIGMAKQALSIKRKIEDARHKVVSHSAEMSRLSAAYKRSGSRLRGKRSTKDRIAWYYKDAPERRYPMAQLKSRNRKRGVVYVYGEDTRGHGERQELKRQYDQAKAKHDNCNRQMEALKKQYTAIDNQYRQKLKRDLGRIKEEYRMVE